jgi:hypothetical protein
MTSKKSKSNNYLYVSSEMIKRYNPSIAWVFGYIAYFAARDGYDTSKSWPALVKKYTNISIDTYKKALNKLVEDEILIKTHIEDAPTHHNRYTLNSDNAGMAEIYHSYMMQFNSSYKMRKHAEAKAAGAKLESLPLIELNPLTCDTRSMTGKQAMHQRLAVTIEAIALNSSARRQEYDKKSPQFLISSYQWLAAELGRDYRTIKAAIHTITNSRLTFDKKKNESKNKGNSIVLILRKAHSISSKIKNQFSIFDKKCERYKKALKAELRTFEFKPRPS